MESSAHDTFGNQNSGSASTGSANTETSDTAFSRDSSSDAHGMADRATSAASSAGDKIADAGSSVRDRAGTLKATIADALQSGAERLRQQGAGGGQIAGSTGSGTDVIAEDNRLVQTSNQLADLSFRGLIVHIGAVPTVRLCWRRQHEDVEEEARLLAQKMAPALMAEPASRPAPPPLPNYGTSSFFEKPAPVVVAPVSQPAPALVAQPVAIEIRQASLAPTPSYSALRPSSSSPKAPPAEPDPSTGDWRKDALARFKRMPHLGR